MFHVTVQDLASVSPYLQNADRSDWGFKVPPELEAGEPPEARGLARDQVRLMVSYHPENRITHSEFRGLPDFLEPGDLLVVNTSATRNAALNAARSDGLLLELHLSTHLGDDSWIVELRSHSANGTQPFMNGRSGESLKLPGVATVRLLRPFIAPNGELSRRLWIATVRLPCPVEEYLNRHGFPIRYGYVKKSWPLSYYQTVYATELGSAEMASAGRPFSNELITRLVAKGVQIAPLILHTGVSSLEIPEQPFEEFIRIPKATARLVNMTRGADNRVVAVGTTVVRALESLTDSHGTVHSGEKWTDLVIEPTRAIHSVSALLTGFHEPRSTHLSVLTALADFEHIRIAYEAALNENYLWHEFGDSHLIVREGS
jgi:S-adenosylmethionine:tRNA ribosyltransferase-isomerase